MTLPRGCSRERHTRQGCAPGQTHGTLDRDWGAESSELGVPTQWASTSHTAMAERQGRPAPDLRTISASSTPCWCDGKFCHPDPDRPGWWTWPGKADGAPHPRA
jgi:hypothetical protein